MQVVIRLILYTDQLVLRRNGVFGDAKGHETAEGQSEAVEGVGGVGGEQVAAVTPNSAAIVEGSSQITVRGIDNTVTKMRS